MYIFFLPVYVHKSKHDLIKICFSQKTKLAFSFVFKCLYFITEYFTNQYVIYTEFDHEYFKLVMIILGYSCFTVPRLKLNLLNGSPRVLGSDVYADFSSNKPASIRCTLDGSSEDCEL